MADCRVSRRVACRFSITFTSWAASIVLFATVASAQPSAPSAYWLARWNDPCGYLPGAAPGNRSAAVKALRGREAAPVVNRQYAVRNGYGGVSGYEEMLAASQAVLSRFVGDLKSGVAFDELKARYAKDFSMIGSALQEGEAVRSPPPPAPADAPPNTLVRQAYFTHVHKLYRYSYLALAIAQRTMSDGANTLDNDQVAEVLAIGPMESAQLFAAATADRSRDRLAAGTYVLSAGDERAMVCLSHAADMFLSATVNRLGGGNDAAGQRSMATRSIAVWRTEFADTQDSFGKIGGPRKRAFEAYSQASSDLAQVIVAKADVDSFAKDASDAEAVRSALIKTLNERHRLQLAVANEP